MSEQPTELPPWLDGWARRTPGPDQEFFPLTRFKLETYGTVQIGPYWYVARKIGSAYEYWRAIRRTSRSKAEYWANKMSRQHARALKMEW